MPRFLRTIRDGVPARDYAKGVLSHSPGSRSAPWVTAAASLPTPTGVASIPNIALVPRQSVFCQQPKILILKRLPLVMFLLVHDVCNQLLNMSRTDRKRAITILPVEVGERW